MARTTHGPQVFVIGIPRSVEDVAFAAPDSQSAAMVSESAAPPSLTLATLPGVSAASSAGATMIRDAQLDAYLNAHRATRAGGATALPGTALLTVDVAVPANAQR